MATTTSTIYCFDSSAFIDTWRRYYPQKHFPTLWEGISSLISEGRIVVPKEAEKEIIAGNDELKAWFKQNLMCVKPYTQEQIVVVSEIVNKYPRVSQYNKVKPIHADPFVVALAKIDGATVVTWEGPNGSTDNPHIPDLCKEYQIPVVSMLGVFENEEWYFKH